VKAVFADTFYWIALTVPSEAEHERAHRLAQSIVTTDEVLSEYLSSFPVPRTTCGKRLA
jgi:hypothetical protein